MLPLHTFHVRCKQKKLIHFIMEIVHGFSYTKIMENNPFQNDIWVINPIQTVGNR